METYTTPTGMTYDLFTDMLKQSHLLIAGASGSGKSVLVNGLICTALYSFPFTDDGSKKLILIDPKRTELHPYKNLPHTLRYASEPEEMVDALHYALGITEQRYRKMEDNGWRMYHGSDVYVIIEELADLMTTQKHIVQPLIQRLCQIARAAKVHVWCITQCPLREIICTPIKVNMTGIVALRTRCAQDSRNIIGCNGAENLPKYGDCLYYNPDMVQPERHAVPYITEDEQATMIEWWMRQKRTQKAEETYELKPKKGFLARLFGR